MYYSGQVFGDDRIQRTDVPPFFSNKRFIMIDSHTNQYGIFKLDAQRDDVSGMPLENIGQALLVRKRDFEHK
jgi:hypothetical protein